MWYLRLAEAGIVPDGVVRPAIRWLNVLKLRELSRVELSTVLRRLDESPIAVHCDLANQQHYAVPPEFFQLVLGPRLKYSCCWWDRGTTDLAAAEEAMLDLYCHRARLEDGQAVLDLGCGWGSLALYLAGRFPSSRILALSNSSEQRTFIEARAPSNLTVVTCDVNDFAPSERFDRIVSIEMLEHVRNYGRLFPRLAESLEPGGLLFTHVFCHREHAYLFDARSEADWIERNFFSGGVMPSAHLLAYRCAPLVPEAFWPVPGHHYEKTANAWLARLDARADQALELLGSRRALVQWRLFFLACAELFGYRGGSEWMVAHHLFRKLS